MITASIVLYNTSLDELRKVISSYNPDSQRKLFLIDNSLKIMDTSFLEEYGENIEYIFNNENLGYGSAHNKGLKKAIEIGSEYHIILNPDICFNSEILDTLIEYANNNPDVVYILPKVFYPDGKLQYLCRHLPYVWDLFARRFFVNLKIMKKIDFNYSLKFFSYNKIINPPCLSGCFMFLRVNTIKENNLFFDDRYFMYFEDFDYIRRLHRVGKTIFFPEVSIIHVHAAQAHTSKKMFWIFVRSMIMYFNKWGWLFDKERRIWNKEIDQEIKELDI